jgi:hypothetical protein
MFSQGTKFKLYQVLKAYAENESIIEEQRQILGKLEIFEPWAAFQRLC